MSKYLTKKLGEVCDVSSGNSAPQKKALFEGGNLPFFRTSDVGAAHISRNLCKTRDYMNEDGIKGMSLYEKGTILFPKSGASTFLNHRVIMGCDGYVSSHLATIWADKNIIDENYLFDFLLTVDAKKIGANSSYPSLKVSDIGKIEIPLPPLSEQKKIVAKLDAELGKIKEAKRLREEALADTDRLLPSTLHEIFAHSIGSGQEAGKVKGWEEVKISEIAEIKGGKRLPKGSKLLPSKTNHPYLRVIDFKNGILNDDQIRYIDDKTFEEIKRYTISCGDVFVSIAGTIGLICRIPQQFDGANLTENAAKITDINAKVAPDFLYWQLQDNSVQDNFKSRKSQTTIPKLALFKIASQKILLPSLAEQRQIVTRLDKLSEQVRTLRELQKAQLDDLKSLEKAVLREAFEQK